MNRAIQALLLALVCLPAWAAETWYEVEILLFENLNTAANSETWPAQIHSPDLTDSIQLLPAAATTTEYALLPKENHQLKDAYRKLANSANYRPLLHLAWRQAIPEREKADRIYIGNPTASGDNISGIISIGKGRYLHVDTDLILHKMQTQPQDFRIQGNLRTRSREVHYLDHPLVGMLILFTPYSVSGGEVTTDEAAAEEASLPMDEEMDELPAVPDDETLD